MKQDTLVVDSQDWHSVQYILNKCYPNSKQTEKFSCNVLAEQFVGFNVPTRKSDGLSVDAWIYKTPLIPPYSLIIICLSYSGRITISIWRGIILTTKHVPYI